MYNWTIEYNLTSPYIDLGQSELNICRFPAYMYGSIYIIV